MNTQIYPSDVSDEEWQFVVPYLTLMKEEAPQRVHDLRQLFNAVRYGARSRCAWRYLPHDFPPWAAVYQQFDRWLKAGVFAAMVKDLRELLRVVACPRTTRRHHASRFLIRTAVPRAIDTSVGHEGILPQFTAELKMGFTERTPELEALR
jgi:transposase